jgi:sec-independent protein translocase protein TatC
MKFSDRYDNSDDLFADTRMTFGEHLEDLRVHLWRAVYGFLVALLFGFAFGWPMLRFISAPVEAELGRFYDARAERMKNDLEKGKDEEVALNSPKILVQEFNVLELLKALGLKPPEGASEDDWVPLHVKVSPLAQALATREAQQRVYRRPGLATLGPMEAFMAYVKVSFVVGLVLGSPWIFVQIWAFVAAGLYPHEKRLVNVYLPISLILFLAGVLVCQFLVIPRALQALLWFNSWLDLEPDIRFNEWLGFAILLPVLFGVSFQLPMVMMFLERIGVVTTAIYVQKWRIAVFLIFAFAAFVAPVDAFSMLSLALAMCGLYGLGILLCRLNPHKGGWDVDVPESEEMVEV